MREQLAELARFEDVHLALGKRMFFADGGALYPLDVLAAAAINRSVNLLRGFATLMEARNFVASAPLLRVQLDNCLRFSAASLVEDPHAFATWVLDGGSIRELKDRTGRKLTDRYLVDLLSVEEPWVSSVYEQTSGYIHLSGKHIFNSLSVKDVGDRTVEFKLGVGDTVVPDAIYAEAIEAFEAATDLFLRQILGWIITKESVAAASSQDP